MNLILKMQVLCTEFENFNKIFGAFSYSWVRGLSIIKRNQLIPLSSLISDIPYLSYKQNALTPSVDLQKGPHEWVQLSSKCFHLNLNLVF